MLIQPFDVDVHAIQRAQFLGQTVREGQQFDLKRSHHLAVDTFQLLRVDKLALLLRKRQQLQFALNDFCFRSLSNEIEAAITSSASSHLA
ncbi:hypothetical protein CO712_04900 [Burkholderia gladioli pv. gladioli]|nr:hypothetical protein CO712_04900 [Burkholderia gladioli pv. gladioli]